MGVGLSKFYKADSGYRCTMIMFYILETSSFKHSRAITAPSELDLVFGMFIIILIVGLIYTLRRTGVSVGIRSCHPFNFIRKSTYMGSCLSKYF